MIDQQRLDFYINLIDQLIVNPKQGLSKIQENINLLDEDFVKLLVQVAQEAENDNDINFANFLYTVSHEIVNQLHLSSSIPFPSPPPKVSLILQFLEIAYQSHLNPDVIYSFLEENLEQVDDEFAELFELYILDQLNHPNNNDALKFVGFIVDLCPILAEFPLGNQENNLEIAIKGCETVIKEFLSVENHPKAWALVENSLGNFYTKRIRGNRSDNLEKAINYFTNALTVQTTENDAEGWALVQNNLANTYNQRIQGSRANNLEIAIKCCYDALEIRTKELYPEYWADTQINLANAYLYRIFGDRSQNLEEAIKCNYNALEIYTYEAFPEHWASIQSNLGGVYFYRIQDSRSDNLEQAINCYQEALKVRTKEKLPYFWAETKNNLGKAYQERIEGAWINNFLKAIECYENALTIWTKDVFPEQWALVKINLGETYRNNRVRQLEENYELAIECYQDALKIYTVTSFPERWAMTQNDLGCAYAERIKDSKKENLKKAITYFKAALTIHNQDNYPRECAETLGHLGRVYYENEELIKADKALKAAIKTIETLRDEIISGDQNKQKLASYFHDIYRLLVEVCLKLDYNREALEYVERSKTRNLIELIFTRSIKNIFPENVAVQLENIRDNIANYQEQLHGDNIENSSLLIQKIKQLRQQRNDLQDRYLPIGASFKLDLFQSTLDECQIIVEWYILFNYFVTFVITKNFIRIVHKSKPQHIKSLEKWTSDYLKSYRQNNFEWKEDLEKKLKQLSEILALDEIINQLNFKNYNHLIIIPHRYLHLLPIHAAQLSNNYILLNYFKKGVSYAPSCQLLQLTQHKQPFDFQNLLGVQDPTNDLVFSNIEVGMIKDFFAETTLFPQQKATKSAIVKQQKLLSNYCSHFACHGEFNVEEPLKSALILVNHERLTLNDIFELNLSQCSLVTLSACETGITDATSISDEYIGLTSGFLSAGIPNVVSSLWKVNDLSTTLLMNKLYENLKLSPLLKSGRISCALNQTQTWLKNMTVEQFEQEIIKFKPYIDQLRKGQRIIVTENIRKTKERQPYPFASPYYWAGFIAVGF